MQSCFSIAGERNSHVAKQRNTRQEQLQMRSNVERVTKQRFGQGQYRYELLDDWQPALGDETFGMIPGVVVDSQDRVYAFHRGPHPIMVFDSAGQLLAMWGDGHLIDAHGLYIADDVLFITDRAGQTVEKWTLDGKRLLTIGEKGKSAPKYSNEPFNMPQSAAVSANGDIFVADGEGNAAIHKYSADGTHLLTWGGHGSGETEFGLPHGLWINPAGEVVVADRGNNRISFFDQAGTFSRAWSEIDGCDNLFMDDAGSVFVSSTRHHDLRIYSPEGELVSSWGGPERSTEPGMFSGSHGMWTDSAQNLYVSEAFGKRIQKFARV
jgi:DNA-binding beta-propeller fold protein YncE